MSRTKEALAWAVLIVGGGLVGFYLAGVYLRWQWNRAMEEAP